MPGDQGERRPTRRLGPRQDLTLPGAYVRGTGGVICLIADKGDVTYGD